MMFFLRAHALDPPLMHRSQQPEELPRRERASLAIEVSAEANRGGGRQRPRTVLFTRVPIRPLPRAGNIVLGRLARVTANRYLV